jgi:hypothetical protein
MMSTAFRQCAIEGFGLTVVLKHPLKWIGSGEESGA